MAGAAVPDPAPVAAALPASSPGRCSAPSWFSQLGGAPAPPGETVLRIHSTPAPVGISQDCLVFKSFSQCLLLGTPKEMLPLRVVVGRQDLVHRSASEMTLRSLQGPSRPRGATLPS